MGYRNYPKKYMICRVGQTGEFWKTSKKISKSLLKLGGKQAQRGKIIFLDEPPFDKMVSMLRP